MLLYFKWLINCYTFGHKPINPLTYPLKSPHASCSATGALATISISVVDRLFNAIFANLFHWNYIEGLKSSRNFPYLSVFS